MKCDLGRARPMASTRLHVLYSVVGISSGANSRVASRMTWTRPAVLLTLNRMNQSRRLVAPDSRPFFFLDPNDLDPASLDRP